MRPIVLNTVFKCLTLGMSRPAIKQHMIGPIEGGQDPFLEERRSVDDDVVIACLNHLEDRLHIVDRDPLRLVGIQRSRQNAHAGGVLHHELLQQGHIEFAVRLDEVVDGALRHQAQGYGGIAELEIEIDQGDPLARLGQTGGEIRRDEGLAGTTLRAEDDDPLAGLGFLLARQPGGDALERRTLALADLGGAVRAAKSSFLSTGSSSRSRAPTCSALRKSAGAGLTATNTALTPGTRATIFRTVSKPSSGCRSTPISTTSGLDSSACAQSRVRIATFVDGLDVLAPLEFAHQRRANLLTGYRDEQLHYKSPEHVGEGAAGGIHLGRILSGHQRERYLAECLSVDDLLGIRRG